MIFIIISFYWSLVWLHYSYLFLISLVIFLVKVFGLQCWSLKWDFLMVLFLYIPFVLPWIVWHRYIYVLWEIYHKGKYVICLVVFILFVFVKYDCLFVNRSVSNSHTIYLSNCMLVLEVIEGQYWSYILWGGDLWTHSVPITDSPWVAPWSDFWVIICLWLLCEGVQEHLSLR